VVAVVDTLLRADEAMGQATLNPLRQLRGGGQWSS